MIRSNFCVYYLYYAHRNYRQHKHTSVNAHLESGISDGELEQVRSIVVHLTPPEAELTHFIIGAGRFGSQKVVVAAIVEQALDAKEPDAEHELPVHHLERHVRLVLAT